MRNLRGENAAFVLRVVEGGKTREKCQFEGVAGFGGAVLFVVFG